jgi:hypothetical protein
MPEMRLYDPRRREQLHAMRRAGLTIDDEARPEHPHRDCLHDRRARPTYAARCRRSNSGAESPSPTAQYGYRRVEGQVKNITDAPLKSVEVVVNWYTASGTFVTSDDALIEYRPIMPGQTSPFDVSVHDNPQMDNYVVEFKELLGAKIVTKDSTRR